MEGECGHQWAIIGGEGGGGVCRQAAYHPVYILALAYLGTYTSGTVPAGRNTPTQPVCDTSNPIGGAQLSSTCLHSGTCSKHFDYGLQTNVL